MSTERTDPSTPLRAPEVQVLSAAIALDDGYHIVVLKTHAAFPDQHVFLLVVSWCDAIPTRRLRKKLNTASFPNMAADRFCERGALWGIIQQPMNSFSGLSFLVTAYVLAHVPGCGTLCGA